MTDRDDEPEDWGEVFAELREDDVEIAFFEPLAGDHAPVESESNDSDEQMGAVRLQDFEAAEIRRGKRLLAKPRGSGQGPAGDPSEHEIRLMCIAVRSEWSGADLRRARCHQGDRVEIRTVRCEGG